MFNNPYWNNFAAVPMNPYVAPQPLLPQPQQPMVSQPQQQPAPVQPSPAPVATTWNWKVTDSYQHMLMESVPFDGTPVLFMLKNESVFYVVSMVDGKKMVNGYSFTPLDTAATTSEPQLTPEEQTEQRFAKLETGMAAIAEQLSKLVEVRQHESNTGTAEKTTEITRQPIN